MEKVIKRIVQALDDAASLTSDERDIAEYALYNVFTTSATLLGLGLVSWLAGLVPASFVALATGAAFRWSMGGAHYSSPYSCIVSSVAGPVLMSLVGSWVSRLTARETRAVLAGAVLALIVFTAYVVWRYSPAETPNNPIAARRKPGLRRLSFVTLALWSALAFRLLTAGHTLLLVASSLALARQSITVTPIGYRLFSTIDTWLRISTSLLGRRCGREEATRRHSDGWARGRGR